MTVSSIVPVNTYTGNSFCKKFDFDFLIESGSELIVQLTNKNGKITTLKEGIDYSINEIGNKEGSYIIFPLETSSYDVLNENEKITLMLTLVIKQESEFRNSSYFNFNILEWTFDYIVRILQIINRKIERCVKVKEGDNISPDNLINDLKDSEINTKNYFIAAKQYMEKALEYFLHSKDWAIKSDGKVQEEDFSSKYYALDAKKSAKLAASYVSFHYVPFCVNRGNVEDGQPALFKLEGNILKTQGVFDITTAQGKFYDSLSDFSLDITNLPEGKYNIFIDPLEGVITLKNNTVYLGNEFPALAITGDYLFNVSSAPYNLEEKTVNGSEKEIGLVLAGTLNISSSKKEIVVNPYNKNLQDFKIEQDILNNKVVRMFDLIPKDHKLSYEEKEGLELLGEYVYKEAADGRRGYPDFYNKCLEEYKEGTSNTTEVSGVTIKVHSNGHKFYNISDKAKIDNIYNDTKIAWYYGIDTANERILLPRNDYFFQNNTEVGKYIKAGLPNITGNTYYITYIEEAQTTGAFTFGEQHNRSAGNSTGLGRALNFDASRSSNIYGNSNTVQPQSVGVAIYMVVGNTQVTQSKTAVKQVTTSENDTLPLGVSMYSPKPLEPNAGWVKSTGVYLSGKIYETFYNKSLTKIGQAFCAGYIRKSTESFDDYDLVINQEEMSFRLPLYNGSENIIDGTKRVQKTWGTTIDLTHNSIIYGGAYSSSYDDDGIIQFSYDKGTTWNTLMIHDRGFGEWMSPPLPRGTKIKSSGGTTGAGSTDKYIFTYQCKGCGDLYFKLGNALENQQLIDCSEVLEELNNKVNLSEAAAASMPSSKRTNLEIGVSGTTYTAPANGWYNFSSDTGGTEFIGLTNDSSSSIGFTTWSSGAGQIIRGICPAKKGDKVRAIYSTSGNNKNIFFCESEGSN